MSLENNMRSSQRRGELNSGPTGFLTHMREKNFSMSQIDSWTEAYRKIDTHSQENVGCLESEWLS